jgi:hypothetical protein
MVCPNCGARNAESIPRKPLKVVKGARWQPKRRSQDTDDFRPPTITLHPDCQKRLVGNPFNGYEVLCGGQGVAKCQSYFNCWTGNVDDGLYNAPLEKSREQQIDEAVALKKMQEETELQTRLITRRKQLRAHDFGYEFNNGIVYCRFGGTKWKLDKLDVGSIIHGKWDTDKSKVIRNSLANHNVNSDLAIILLTLELAHRQKKNT